MILATLWGGPASQTATLPALMLFVYAAVQGGWPVPVLWLLGRGLPRLAPAIRTRLWWGACVQMLVVWLVAFAAHGSGESQPWLIGLWFGGVTVRLLLLSVQFRRTHRLIRESLPTPACAATDMVVHLASRLALDRAPAVWVSASLTAPVLAGLRRPVLLIPAAALEPEVGTALRMALAHELAHLRRRDLGWGLVPVLTQTALFFYPLAWIAVREYVLAREEACDVEARHVTGTTPDEYGAMLLEYVAAARRPAPRTLLVRSHYSSLLRRLNAMRIPYEQPKQGPVGAFCSVCILVAVCVSALQIGGSIPMPTKVAAFPPAGAAPDRVAAVSHILSVPRLTAAKLVRHESLRRSRPISIARLRATAPARLQAVKPRADQSVATLPHRSFMHRRVPAQAHSTAIAVIGKQPAEEALDPQTMAVAWDTPPAPRDSPDVTLDLSQMQSDLQALRQQMRDQQRQLQQTLPLASVPDEELAQQLRDEMRSQFSPRFRQHGKPHDSDLRAQLDAEMPAIRAEVDQARRDAAQAQRQMSPAAVQAREQALRQSRQAREQALQELQKELPRIQEELKKNLQSPTGLGADDMAL